MDTNTATNYNVVGFTKNTIEDKINAFLDYYESENTRRNYTRYIKKMFMYITGKEIYDLTKEDILSINIEQVKKYKAYLKNQIGSNTNNQELSACKALWDDFIENGDLKFNPFIIRKIKIRKKQKHYGSLTEEELEQLYDYCLTLKKGMTKKLYFEFLATVTCRRSIAENIKFEDIKWTLNNNDKKYYWVVNAFDKTEEVNRAISEEFYNRLKENFKNYDQYDQKKGYIFNISGKTMETTLKNFCEYAGINKEERNIVQHSIKSTGLDRIQRVFGDINITARAGGHSSIQTTYDNYVGKNVDYSQQPSILLGKDYNIDMLSELTKEQLLDVINSCSKVTLIESCIQAEKKGYISLDDENK